MTYISWGVHFNLSGINFPHQVSKNLKTLFNRVDENHIIKLEKDLIPLDPHSFERMEGYLACVKELQLKLGGCVKNYQKKDGKLIELILMNLRTLFDMFMSKFRTNWKACKEDGKDYTYEALCGLLIIDQHRFLGEGNIGGKHQAHLLNGNGKVDTRNRVQSNASTPTPAYHDQGPQRQPQ
jgi:hypothetical protein